MNNNLTPLIIPLYKKNIKAPTGLRAGNHRGYTSQDLVFSFDFTQDNLELAERLEERDFWEPTSKIALSRF